MSRFARHVKQAICRHRILVADGNHGARCATCGSQLSPHR